MVWRNTGIGFTNVPIPGLPGVTYSSTAWGDFDGDRRLDFLVAGTTNGDPSGTIAQLWHNTGTGFSNVPVPNLPGVQRYSGAAFALGDYDNDGRLDFILTGANATGAVVQIWHNTVNGFSR